MLHHSTAPHISLAHPSHAPLSPKTEKKTRRMCYVVIISFPEKCSEDLLSNILSNGKCVVIIMENREREEFRPAWRVAKLLPPQAHSEYFWAGFFVLHLLAAHTFHSLLVCVANLSGNLSLCGSGAREMYPFTQF